MTHSFQTLAQDTLVLPPRPTGRSALVRRLIWSAVAVVAAVVLAWVAVARQAPTQAVGPAPAPPPVGPPPQLPVVPGQRVLPQMPAEPAPRGSYVFWRLRSDGSPVSYDPCQTIDYWIDPTGMPADGASIIHAGVRQVSQATGFAFQYRGEYVIADVRDCARTGPRSVTTRARPSTTATAPSNSTPTTWARQRGRWASTSSSTNWGTSSVWSTRPTSAR